MLGSIPPMTKPLIDSPPSYHFVQANYDEKPTNTDLLLFTAANYASR